jgi:sulfite reductase alpha subunit-like flavoprotein
MQELGATRILNRGIGDDRDEDRFYTGWDSWTPQLWKALHAPDKPLVRVIPKPAFKIDYSPGEAAPAVANETLVPPGATPLTLMENTLLTPVGYDRDIRHYVFKIKDTSLTYRVGDVLAIWPRNHADQVDAFCKMYGLDPTQELRIVAGPEARNPIPEELNVRQLFQCVLDVFGKPNRAFFDNLALFATDKAEQARLELMTSEDPEGKALYRELTHDMLNHADVLRLFPSARPPLEQLINMIPPIKPRSYSIASAPNMHPDEIELCIVAVDWEVPSTKEQRFGQTTSYLKTTKAGDTIMCAVKPSSIVLPEDPMAPVLMAGMGTGLAPWRALTQHRVFLKQQGTDVGPCVIFYGARKAATEYLYREEFEKYEKMGVLTMHTAFSRDQARKIYVQNRITEDYQTVYKQLMEQNGSFYVCGSSRNVPEDIYNAMKEVMMKGGNMDEHSAEAALSSLKMSGRYTVEAWS